MAFGDVKVAAEMRDLIARICERVVAGMYLAPRTGKVISVNTTARTTQVLLVGDTANITVAYGKGITPVVNDIVRVMGQPGAYYILNFASW